MIYPAWNKPTHRLQEVLIAEGLYLGKHDGQPGPKTATALVSAWRQGRPMLDPKAAVVRDFLAFMAETMPTQREVADLANRVLKSDPNDPSRGKWADGGEWAVAHIRWFDIPLLGRVRLADAAAWRLIVAFGYVELKYPGLSFGKIATICLRRKNWSKDPKVGWSLHFGFAFDADLNLNGKWERDEKNLSEDMQGALVLLRLMGVTLGLDWHGASLDAMHIEICSI
jgi:hypothetical protein